VPSCKDRLCRCPPGSQLRSNSSNSEGSPSISYQVGGLPEVALAASSELSELEGFAESAEWLCKLLSTAESQRVQDFEETVDEQTVLSENVPMTRRSQPAFSEDQKPRNSRVE